MGYLVSGTIGKALGKLYERIYGNNPFGPDSHRDEDDIHFGIGEQVAEREQQSENRARRAYGRFIDHGGIVLIQQPYGCLGIFGRVGDGGPLCRGLWRYGDIVLADELHESRVTRMILVMHKSIVKGCVLDGEYAHVAERGAYAANNIKGEEALRAPEILEYAAKHPQRIHIEQDMGKSGPYIVRAAVHEHMCEQLPDAELGR